MFVLVATAVILVSTMIIPVFVTAVRLVVAIVFLITREYSPNVEEASVRWHTWGRGKEREQDCPLHPPSRLCAVSNGARAPFMAC